MTHDPNVLLGLLINTIHPMSNEQESSFVSRASRTKSLQIQTEGTKVFLMRQEKGFPA